MGKTVLITGATQGIGAAIAETFAKAGFDVAIGCHTQRSFERGEPVEQACLACGVKARRFVADAGDFAAAGQMVAEVVKVFGGIDVLINNAGTTRDGPIARMSEENYDIVLNANLKSVFNMTRHVTPLMMKKRSGKIINISSVVGLRGNRGQANYAASKAGIIGLTQSVAKELGSRGICCNAIAPGYIETAMTNEMPEAAQEAILSCISLGRGGKPQDIADAALFLASSDYITGQVLVVDGGMNI